MLEKMYSCTRDGLTIIGKIYAPDWEGKYPIAMLSHGFTGNYADMEEAGRFFARNGYAAFSLSFCGGTADAADPGLKSQGSPLDMTISSEVDDLDTALSYAQSLDFTDADHAILFGASQGGLISALLAARRGPEIEKLVMCYPALCIPDHARRGILGGASYDVNHVPDQISCPAITVGKKLHDDVFCRDIFLDIAPYKGQVLIIHGLKDHIVDYRYSIRAQMEYGDQCRLQLVPEADHGFTPAQRQSALESVRLFLQGQREVLTFRIIITRKEEIGPDEQNVYFTAYCDCDAFHGTLLQEGCDRQTRRPDGSWQLCAEYTFTGLDRAGDLCHIHVVNQERDGHWKPEITTDSKALAYLEHADVTAIVEFGLIGPLIRIFAS